jgi:hypothetical protein
VTILWLLWITLPVVAFIVLETIAIKRGKPTLSFEVYSLGKNFPLAIALLGLLLGGLLVHFFWHWCPPGSQSMG